MSILWPRKQISFGPGWQTIQAALISRRSADTKFSTLLSTLNRVETKIFSRYLCRVGAEIFI
jgi:hypothetical protein